METRNSVPPNEMILATHAREDDKGERRQGRRVER